MLAQSLTTIPSLQTTGSLARAPSADPGDGDRRRGGQAYVYRTWVPGTPRPKDRPTRHDTADLGLGLAAAGEAAFFPLRELAKLGAEAMPLVVELGGRELRIHYRSAAFTAWAEAADGALVDGVLAYEWGWKRFHPGSRIFAAPGSSGD